MENDSARCRVEAHLADAAHDHFERQSLKILTGTTGTSNAWGSNPPITFEDIKKAMEKLEALPPVPILASSVMFPGDVGIIFKGDGEQEYVLAHPDTWAKLPAMKQER